MDRQKFTHSSSKNIDEEIKNYIKLKREENQALKKLLHALEDAKRNSGMNPVRN